MKVKVIDEMDNIQLNVSHKELLIIKKSLENSRLIMYNVDKFNDELFDRDEIKSATEIREINDNICKKISKKLKKILVW